MDSDGSEVVISPASARDAAVVALLDALTAELATSGYSAEQTFGYSVGQIEASGVHLVAARSGDALVGVGGVQLDAEGGELKRFYVAPSHRGTGVAAALLDALVDHAVSAGARVLRLETGERQHRAIAFYTRHGFERIPRFGPYIHSRTSVCLQRHLEGPRSGDA